MRLRSFLSGIAAGALLAVVPIAGQASPTVAIVNLARQGMPAPDGNGTFSNYFSFADPVLNNASEAGFTGRFTGTALGASDDDYLVRARGGIPGGTARPSEPATTGRGGHLRQSVHGSARYSQ